MPAPGSTMVDLKGVVPFGRQRFLEETAVISKPASTLAPRPGEIFSRLLDKGMVSDETIDALVEAGTLCGVQLERWQARVLAGAIAPSSSLLGSAGSTRVKPLEPSPVRAVSLNELFAAIAPSG